MAHESNLHYLFSSAEPPAQKIDVASVIRRSKARRLPKQIGAGGIFTLAIGGISVAGVQGLSSLHSATSSSAGAPAQPQLGATDSSGQESTNGNKGIDRAPADKINLCGGSLAEIAPSQSGLVLAVQFPDADAGTESVDGTVTMTNTSQETLNGYTAGSPAITLSRDGIVLWHSNGPTSMLARQLTLAPGESVVYSATFSPVICSVEDDSAPSFRDNLTAAPAGRYQLSAAIDFTGDSGADLVTGPTETVTLR